jgi:hypothetical protein
MASDSQTVHIGENSPEQVAYKLLPNRIRPALELPTCPLPPHCSPIPVRRTSHPDLSWLAQRCRLLVW